MKSQSIGELLLFIENSDVDAFRELFARYKVKIFNQVNKRIQNADQAKDLTQEVFLNLWLNRHRLSTLADFESYLYVMIRNKVISFFRRNSARLAGEQFLMDGIQQLENSSEEIFLARELEGHINVVVEKLPARMKRCFQLSRSEGKKIRDIAAELQLSEQSVRNNISEALRYIRSNLADRNISLFLFLIIHSAFGAWI